MIDREQVLHVARLARLELTEDEVSRMTGELSAILDHIEKISTLDLDGVPPTTHVVHVPNALRPDEPRPSLPREVALSNAPAVDDDGFSVRSPRAGATSSLSPPRRRRTPSPRATSAAPSCSRPTAPGLRRTTSTRSCGW